MSQTRPKLLTTLLVLCDISIMNDSTSRLFTAGPNDNKRKIDRVTRKLFPALPLSAVFSAIRKGRIYINGKKITSHSVQVQEGDSLLFPDTFPMPRDNSTDNPLPDVSIDIIYENEQLLIINKPTGTALFGSEGLIHIIRQQQEQAQAPSLSFSPSFVHRIDRPSSGLLICAKTLPAAQELSHALSRGMIRKHYLAIVEGRITEKQIWEDHLQRNSYDRITEKANGDGAQKAHTIIHPISTNRNQTLILAEIRTGRTHQIRAQAAIHRHPLAGDRKYGSNNRQSLLLHAGWLSFHKQGILQQSRFFAPLAASSIKKITTLFGKQTIDEETVQYYNEGSVKKR